MRKRSSLIRRKQVEHSGNLLAEPVVDRSSRPRSVPDFSHVNNKADDSNLESVDTISEMFQEELRASLAQKKGQRVWKKITCPEHEITDCFYINLNSSRDDVEHWLEIKGFSER